MMVNYSDYMTQPQSMADAVSSGYKIGQSMRDNQQKQGIANLKMQAIQSTLQQAQAEAQQAQAEAARKQAMHQKLDVLSDNTSATANDYMEIFKEFPEYMEDYGLPMQHLQSAAGQNERKEALNIYAALKGGNFATGRRLLETRLAAATASGNQGVIDETQSLLEELEEDVRDGTNEVRNMAGLYLAANYDKFAEVDEKLGESRQRDDTAKVITKNLVAKGALDRANAAKYEADTAHLDVQTQILSEKMLRLKQGKPLDPAQQFEWENTVKAGFEKVIAAAGKADVIFQKIKRAAALKTGEGDTALTTLIAKSLDSASVVTESEAKAWLQNSGFFDAVTGQIKKLATGDVYDDIARGKMLDLAWEMRKEEMRSAHDAATAYRNQVKSNKLDPLNVFGTSTLGEGAFDETRPTGTYLDILNKK